MIPPKTAAYELVTLVSKVQVNCNCGTHMVEFIISLSLASTSSEISLSLTFREKHLELWH